MSGFMRSMLAKVFIGLVITLVQLAPALAEVTGGSDSCSAYPNGQVSEEMREKLLVDLKTLLVRRARFAKNSLEMAKECVVDSSEFYCETFVSALHQSLRNHVLAAKISKAIALKTYNPRARNQHEKLLTSIREGAIKPDDIADFRLEGFEFSEEEKNLATSLWEKHFWLTALKVRKIEIKDPSEIANYRNKIQISSADVYRARSFFNKMSLALVSMNPILSFINDGYTKDDTQLLKAFDKMIEYNEGFISSINGMETKHTTGFWSAVNIVVNDHEMGLVNFSAQAQQMIASYPEESRANACASWSNLESQQSTRVYTSIGVGFSTAVVCGVGIWSGVGTIPAAGLCSAAVGDSLLGGYRGYQDAQLAHNSAFAGRLFGRDFKMTPGTRDASEALALERRSNIVFAANMIGILPVARGVSTAVKGGRGELVVLAKMPANDTAVSATEVSSQALTGFLKDTGSALSPEETDTVLTQVRAAQ